VGQRRRQILGEAVGEIGLRRVPRHVREGQHDDDRTAGGPARLPGCRRHDRARGVAVVPLAREAITPAGDGGHEPGGVAAERLAQCRDLHLDVVFLDGRARPDLAQQVVLGHQRAIGLHEHEQQIEGAAAQRHRHAIGEQPAGARQQAPPTERDTPFIRRKTHPAIYTF